MIQKRNKIAITFLDKKYTYESLLQHAFVYAKQFSNAVTAEKVLIFAENSPEWIFAFYGAMTNKSLVVPVDVQSSLKELRYILNDCRPEIVFTSSIKKDLVVGAIQDIEGYSPIVLTSEDISLDNVDQEATHDIPNGDDDSPVLIIYTSGTTGSPKGVMLSFRNMIYNINSVSISVPIFREDSNVMILLPLHHAFPLIGSLIAPLYVGGTVHIAEGMTAEAILKTLNEGKVTIIIGVPRLYDTLTKGVMAKINAKFITRMLYKIVKAIGSQRLSKLVFKSVHKKFGGHIEFLVSGGAALSYETGEIFQTLGFYVLEGYGMTETAPMITFTRPGRRKIGYAGDPLPGIEVKISEENGEVCVRGDNVMMGYYNRPEETAQIIKDGWLHTGDVGILDQYGLKLTGRIKDIIVTPNGKNINPDELEKEIMNSTKLIKEIGVFMNEGVLQAIIVPEMKALREASGDMEELIKNEISSFNKDVATYKRIKRFHLISGELPKTRLGKVQRFLLIGLTNEDKKEQEDNKTHSEVYNLLKAFIDNETGYQARENDHFEIDLSMDSLSRVSLLAYIENTFNIKISEEELDSMSTLALLSSYLEQKSVSIEDKEVSWKEILSNKINTKLPKAGFINWFTSQFSKTILHLFYRYKGTGKENMPKEPCIIVANHRSAIDGVLITSKLRQKVSKNTFFFAKEKHWRSSFARFMARKNNVILMDINKNLRESLQQMSAVLENGKNVIIFPEGTRSKDTNLNPFKETFAIISIEKNVPILPVVIQGSERVLFKKIKFPRLFARIKVDFLKPIYPQKGETAKELRDKVVNIIEQAINPRNE